MIKTLSNYEIYSIENPLFHPQNSDKIYFYFKNSLYFIEINNTNPQKSLISPPVIQDILAYTIYGNKILYINTEGKFYKTNLEISSFKNIFDIPLLKPEQSIGIVNDEILVINNSLYFLNPENQIFEKITDNIEKTAFSDDENKIVWQTKDKIGIIWMKEDFGQPQRKKYETEIIIKTTEEISQAVWYSKTNQHIIFVIGDDIKITELDGRQERNTNNIFSIKNPEIFYNKDNEKLYILSNEQLFEINMKN